MLVSLLLFELELKGQAAKEIGYKMNEINKKEKSQIHINELEIQYISLKTNFWIFQMIYRIF